MQYFLKALKILLSCSYPVLYIMVEISLMKIATIVRIQRPAQRYSVSECNIEKEKYHGVLNLELK